MPELRLLGCASRPLVGYLKALGVLRVVGAQVDPSARGRWRNGVFEMRSALDADDLQEFFLAEYAPSPVLSPWNGGSGFYPKDRQEAVRTIEESEVDRLEPYRRAIAAVRQSLGESGLTDKPEVEQKAPLIRLLRRSLPDEALAWIDAAMVVREDGLAYPPLLGSGGNDGRFDFSNNYAHCVVDCVLRTDDGSASSNLSAALWDQPTVLQRKLSLAHFSRDSSPNNSPYGEADSLGNPWDLILAVEGSLLLVAGAARRHGSNLQGSLVAPFTVRPTGAGYGSAVDGESGRAELWLPLWENLASHGEIATLARESRAEVGGSRPRQAATGLDFARAAGEIGVARGITAFERYALLERAGQSSLAVPTGQISVEERPGAEALRGIDHWLASALRFAGGDRCPQGPRLAIRRLEDVVFALSSRGAPGDACAALEAIGAAEASLSCSGAARDSFVRPLAGAPAKPWIEAGDDGSHEFAIAAAIASLHDPARTGEKAGGKRLPALRDYLHGTKRGKKGTEFDPERRHAVTAQNPTAILAAIHARRHLDAGRARMHDGSREVAERKSPNNGRPQIQLGFAFGARASLDSIQLFAAGELDENRILALVRGLALLRHTGKDPALRPEGHSSVPQPTFALLALVWQPLSSGGSDERLKRSGDAVQLGARPGWAARLTAGSTRSVVDDAALRLRMAGLPPLLDPDDLGLDPSEELSVGRRLGAALLPNLGSGDIRWLAETQIFKNENDNSEKKDT